MTSGVAEAGAYQRVAALLELGRHAEAEALARQGLAQEPQDFRLLSQLAQSLIGQGKGAEAAEAARTLVAQQPESAHAHRLLARSHLAREEFGQAEEAARQAVALDPEDAWSHYTLACALFGQDRTTRARRAAREALRIEPEQTAFLVLLGYLHLRDAHGKEEAQDAFQRALRLEPENTDAVRGLALARSDQLGLDGTIRELRRSLSLDPTDPEPAYDALLVKLWQILKRQEWLTILSFWMFFQGVRGSGGESYIVPRLVVGVLLGAGVVMAGRSFREISAAGWRFLSVVCRRSPKFAVSAASTAICFATGEFWAVAGSHASAIVAHIGYWQRGLVIVGTWLAELVARRRRRG
ncbi:tetratricopeptide repeat protein [Segniliparus rugosus]|uniref:Uncharacterized protein n=1 Tax=Segniliparus rugosus (strain ATCC BAA-974 / DSM 45345 / CCUG 50838 / CIP 108380 / JCM 13579 / CDC 945) TaxID=679197 RepID=E5XU96_SEGRC|nr:tetratricopeptide repeat protein [Segniliparus rugosus]EFV12095.1 hypothetical protein HMPREF9336_03068 [Segniliparus rugosus ATCC BAA-974]